MNLHNEVEKMAYELYKKRGKAEGHDLDDWFEAERIIVAHHRVEEKLETESSSPPQKKRNPEQKEVSRKPKQKNEEEQRNGPDSRHSVKFSVKKQP